MRVLFLDFDGVIVTPRAGILDQFGWAFDPVCIAHLNRVCEWWDCQVVISSSWRRGGDCLAELVDAGFTGTIWPVDWHTPLHMNWAEAMEVRDRHRVALEGEHANSHVYRGDEVQDWLDRHPEVTEYLILDDESDFWPQHMNRLVRTSTYDGILFDHVVQIGRTIGIELLRPRCETAA